MACVDLETRTIDTGSLKIIWKLMNFRKSVPFNRKLWHENYLDRKFIFPLLRKKLKFREFKPGIFTEGKEPIVFRWEANRRTREETTSWPCQPLAYEFRCRIRTRVTLSGGNGWMQRDWSDNSESVYLLVNVNYSVCVRSSSFGLASSLLSLVRTFSMDFLILRRSSKRRLINLHRKRRKTRLKACCNVGSLRIGSRREWKKKNYACEASSPA